MDDIIRFSNVSKNFGGTKALSGVSLSIRAGEVHALMGENGAGKTTLMNILSGLFTQDAGSVSYKGREVKITSPHVSRQLGIATVFQELKNCENLTVAENIFLGREKTKGIFMDYAGMNESARKIVAAYGLGVDVRTPIKKLSVAQMQVVEIAKAIDLKADVLILDEPTSALTVNETQKLFENMRRLKENGVTIIYISHRMEEIFEVADRISVLRNGGFLGTFEKGETSKDEIINLIAGKELAKEYTAQKKELKPLGGAVMSVRELSRKPYVDGVSFELHKGEILGLYGLQGSGRTELIETVFGLYKKDGGGVSFFGNEVLKASAKNSINSRIGMMTEDRKLTGIFFNMDINDNIAIIHGSDITRGGMINTRMVNGITKEYIGRLSIKCSGIKQPIGNLSGGNQQKVVLSRCLSTNPEILLLDEPTRGVDVGAKAEIYELLKELRDKNGVSLLVVSSELPEIILLCDRVIVMKNGRVTGELRGDEIREDAILSCAFNEPS